MRNILVTGGAGFIGSAVVRQLIAETGDKVLNVDKLTYAGNLASVAAAADDPRYRFARHDICDRAAMERLFAEFRPDVVLHLAAESHVDRSIDDPSPFVQTNVVGTFNLLEVARRYWRELEGAARTGFRFHHVSTDEVFGSLGDDGFFTEETPYAPNSPYSSSKASSDHLARAWHRTYGLPVLVTNCSNNYGPYQFPEKLIPLMISKALNGEKLPVYGTGANVRDWLYVEDHARALRLVYETGRIGETYNLGGGGERTNLEIVETLCDTLDALFRDAPWRPHRSLIGFVEDRPGHDLRYAIDASKIQGELGWRPAETFETGLAKTVRWYIDNPDWCATAHAGGYQGERLGAAEVAGASV